MKQRGFPSKILSPPNLLSSTLSNKPSENPLWVALSRDRDHIPSFPRKRESSGGRLKTEDGTQSFQTASQGAFHGTAATSYNTLYVAFHYEAFIHVASVLIIFRIVERMT